MPCSFSFLKRILFLGAVCLLVGYLLSAPSAVTVPAQPDDAVPPDTAAVPDILLPEEGFAIDGDTLEIRVYENQAIPYRWEWSLSGDALELTSEDTVKGQDGMLAAGDSPAMRVFRFTWVTDGTVTVTLTNRRMDAYRGPNDPEDNAGKRLYRAVRQNGVTSLWEETPE